MTSLTTGIDREGLWGRIADAYPGLSIPKIAQVLGKQKQTVYRWRDGETPGLDTLAEISESRNVSLHWLLTGKGPAQVSEKNGTKLPLPSPETKQPGLEPGSVEKVLLAHMQLIAEQNNRIIGLLEMISEKILARE